MAKRSNVTRDSQRVEVEQFTVRLRLYRSVHLKTQGPITGKLYEFPCGGSELDVDALDAPAMLAKMSPVGCCSSSSPRPYFQKVG